MSTTGLPTHLFETYAFYKKNTSSFIRWLSAHNKDARERSSISSVKELLCLANSVISKQVAVPLELYHTLGKTIRARTRVSRFFKRVARPEDHEALVSHEYFTQALQQIHGDLRTLIQNSKNFAGHPDDAIIKRNENPFELLHWEECLKDEDDCQLADQKHVPVPRITAESSDLNHSKGIERDNIGEFMAIALYLSVSLFHTQGFPQADFLCSLGT